MDAKQATMAVRDYFESIKKIKFFFEVNNAKYDEEKKIWTIICNIQNVFDDTSHPYKVGVDGNTGDIIYVTDLMKELSINGD